MALATRTIAPVAAPFGYQTVSGTGPASGVSGVAAVSGPWFVEEQTLSFNYKRVPHGHFTYGAVNLSAANVEYTQIGSHLLVKVHEVSYKVTKVESWYDTSTYTQPQRFTVFPVSADETGMTYETPAAGTLSVAGAIITAQPWYFRRKWENATDQEVNVRLETGDGQAYPGPAFNYYGANHFDCEVSAGQTNITTPNLFDDMFWHGLGYSTAYDDIKIINGPTHAFSEYLQCGQTPNDLGDIVDPSKVLMTSMMGWKSGTYKSANDSTNDVQNLVDTVGQILAYNFTGLGHLGFVSDDNARELRNLHYEKSRHYWGA